LFVFLLFPTFGIGQVKREPLKISGGLSATTIFYSSTGITARRNPFSYTLAGNVNIRIYGYSIPLSFVVSEKNSQFRQPFNQFGLSPKYRWATLHLGYRNIRFSPYVLNGHTIYGAGVELNPGKLRFGVMYGRFKRKINIARKVDQPLIDSLNTFSRKGYSVKLGVGSQNTYVDFVFLKVVDDTLSLLSKDWVKATNPQANVAFGISSKIRFSSKLSFNADAGYSLFTKNIFATKIDDKDVQLVNKYFVPVNLSSQHYGAYEAGITYQPSNQFAATIGYKHIDPGYQTMGVYYMQNDISNFTLKTKSNFWQSKIQINTTIGIESNNLRHLRETTTKRWIGSADLNFAPNKNFGLAANYSNYSINQTGDEVQIADSIKLYQTNSQIMINPRYMIFGKNANHVFILVYNNSQLNDKNPITNEFSGFTLNNYMFNYNLNLTKSGLGLSLGYNYAIVKMKQMDNVNTSLTIGVGKGFFKNKLRLRFSQLFSSGGQENAKQFLLRPSLSGTYKLAKHHNIRFKLYLKNGSSSTKSFTETSGDFTYSFNF
jgi:hypothetical protein